MHTLCSQVQTNNSPKFFYIFVGVNREVVYASVTYKHLFHLSCWCGMCGKHWHLVDWSSVPLIQQKVGSQFLSCWRLSGPSLPCGYSGVSTEWPQKKKSDTRSLTRFSASCQINWNLRRSPHKNWTFNLNLLHQLDPDVKGFSSQEGKNKKTKNKRNSADLQGLYFKKKKEICYKNWQEKSDFPIFVRLLCLLNMRNILTEMCLQTFIMIIILLWKVLELYFSPLCRKSETV